MVIFHSYVSLPEGRIKQTILWLAMESITHLVGGLEILEHVLYFYILGIVAPTDELHHFSEG